MGNIQTKLGDKYVTEWFTDHPTYYIVKTRYFQNTLIRFEIFSWVKSNTIGDSTLIFNINKDLFGMIWYFDNKSDATLFKLVWS